MLHPKSSHAALAAIKSDRSPGARNMSDDVAYTSVHCHGAVRARRLASCTWLRSAPRHGRKEKPPAHRPRADMPCEQACVNKRRGILWSVCVRVAPGICSAASLVRPSLVLM
eukprot:1124635-Prymnesium_polylepis.1